MRSTELKQQSEQLQDVNYNSLQHLGMGIRGSLTTLIPLNDSSSFNSK